MAGFLAQLLPGLLSSAGGGSGILSKLKDAAGSVIGDLVNNNVHSGADFGRSLLKAGAGALGMAAQKPPFMTNQDNAADHRDIAATVQHPQLTKMSSFMPIPGRSEVRAPEVVQPSMPSYTPLAIEPQTKQAKQAAKYIAHKKAKKHKRKVTGR